MIYLALLLVLVAGTVEAKTLYVNNSGSPTCNNATTYANNDAANPWCLIGRAAWGSTSYASPSASEAAAAGDVVLITAGTYTTDGNPTGSRFDVALNPANSGTIGNPITFRGVGTVNIRMTANHDGPTIGADGRDYIVWDNITIDDTYNGSVGDTGPVVFHGTTGSQLINSTIQGHNGSYNDGHATFTDNYNAVRLEGTLNVVVKNNTFSRMHRNATGAGGENEAAVMLYDSENAIIEHNNISDVGAGVYVKGEVIAGSWPQQNNIVRFNRISEFDERGVALNYAYGTKVYQNIIVGTGSAKSAIRFYNQDTTAEDEVTIQNNVIAQTTSGGWAIAYNGTSTLTNVRVFNNIIYGAWSYAIETEVVASQGLGDNTYEHNVYSGYSTFARIDSGDRTFAYWQGTEVQDMASPAGVNSDPLFVNTTDYKLQGTSPAINLGVDILDLDGDTSTTDNVDAGAYITGNEVIGVESAAGPGPRFVPGLLRVAEVQP